MVCIITTKCFILKIALVNNEKPALIAYLRSAFNATQVALEPRVSPEHTSKYVDTVTVFAKT